MQQGWTTLLLVSLSATSVLATPITKDNSLAAFAKRDPAAVVVSKAPSNSPDCGGGKVWSPDELIAAIQQATEYKATNNYQGKDLYPHEFQNRPQTSLNPLKWIFDAPKSFDFPNCDGPLLEFPLMRDTSNTAIFKGGKNRPGKNNPDRVVFTVQGDTTATYCGVITHQKEDDGGILDVDWWQGEMYTGDFRGCDPLF